jgi:hypothetical protein
MKKTNGLKVKELKAYMSLSFKKAMKRSKKKEIKVLIFWRL